MKSHEASSQALLEGSTANKANASFHGAWLVAARSAWMLITLACLMIFFASIPAYLTVLHHVCTGSADIGSTCEINNQLSQANLLALAQSSISLDSYATLVVIIDSISSLTFILTGALIFRRKSNERFALFVSLILVLFGSLGPHLLNRSMLLIAQYPTWQVVLPVLLFQLIRRHPVRCFCPFMFSLATSHGCHSHCPSVLLCYVTGYGISTPLSIVPWSMVS
jgi:hypothetical protein